MTNDGIGVDAPQERRRDKKQMTTTHLSQSSVLLSHKRARFLPQFADSTSGRSLQAGLQLGFRWFNGLEQGQRPSLRSERQSNGPRAQESSPTAPQLLSCRRSSEA
jgi:hypothetical protein